MKFRNFFKQFIFDPSVQEYRDNGNIGKLFKKLGQRQVFNTKLPFCLNLLNSCKKKDRIQMEVLLAEHFFANVNLLGNIGSVHMQPFATLNEIANYCLYKYQEDLNPLEDLRDCGFDTHFEYANSQNEWFMYNHSTRESNDLYDVFVVIAEADEYKNIVRVRVFFEGEEAEASLS